MFHYTYRITNLKLNKHYYGVRTSKIEPKYDLGIKYFSSSTDKEFILDQKENKNNYKYKVIKIFNTRDNALLLEIKLHQKFNVGINEYFYNKSKQTSTGWDTSGRKMSEEFKKNISIKNSGRIFSEDHRKKLSLAAKGKKKSKEHCDSIKKAVNNKGKNHPRFKGMYITPIGEFDSPAALIPLLSLTQMKYCCNEPNRKITERSFKASNFLNEYFKYEDIKDKTYKEIGFGRKLINN